MLMVLVFLVKVKLKLKPKIFLEKILEKFLLLQKSGSELVNMKPIQKELEALQAVEEMIVKEQISLRDACYWLENHTGRSISHVGLKKIIDKKYGTRKERLGIIS